MATMITADLGAVYLVMNSERAQFQTRANGSKNEDD